MAISAKDVKKLRDATGAGMMDCKKALTETNGDFQAAIDFLRKKGQELTNISITPLSEELIAPLNPGMINVTGSQFRGYRFLPDGQK